jgi:hypothetical protein
MFLGSKGYTIPKDLLSPIQHHELRRKLTFKVRQDYGDDKEFKAWRESPHKMYVPRFYGLSVYGDAPSRIDEGKSIQLDFHGTIRAEQVGAVDAFLKAKCGLLELPCGFGKTIVALHLIHRIGKKTLVIVHKEFLLEQWIERIHEFLRILAFDEILRAGDDQLVEAFFSDDPLRPVDPEALHFEVDFLHRELLVVLAALTGRRRENLESSLVGGVVKLLVAKRRHA